MIRLNLFRDEKGNAAALTAIVLVVLIGAASLALDAGQLYLNRARIVNALDSSVLAGVQYLPDHPDLALQTASEYADKNGLKTEECNFAVTESNRAITGTAQRQVGFQFARVLGYDTGMVEAQAGARIYTVGALSGLAPFGVIEDNYQFGQTIVLKEGAGDTTFSGWFGALRLGDGGASTYENNIINGYSGKVEIGDIIPIEAGNMSMPTRRAIEDCIEQCDHSPKCTIDGFSQQCSRILLVPLIRIVSVNSGGHPDQVQVVGFAAFLVDRYTGNGNDNEVEGSFIRYVTYGEATDGLNDHGLYCSQLYL